MTELANLMILMLASVSGAIAVVVVPQWWRQRPSARAERRFAHYIRRAGAENLSATASVFSANPVFSADDESTWLEASGQRIANRLANIGGRKALHRLLAIGGLIGSGVLIVTIVWLELSLVSGLLAAAGSGFGCAYMVYKQMKRRWQIAFLNNLADAVDLIIRAVRSGIPVTESIRAAGAEVNDPVRTEFQQISDSVDVGIDLKEALRVAAARIQLPDFDFFVITLVIQRETGGQLAETLDGLSLILRRRKELRLKVRAMTAEGRMTAAIVSGMPIVAGLAMYMMDPDHMGRLFEPGTGQTMLFSALGMMALGIAVVYQLTKVKP